MLKNRRSPIWRLSGVALLVSLSGCGAAYHEYGGRCVPYLYHAQPPLPYIPYEGCHCPTPGATSYFQTRGGPEKAAPTAEVLAESTTPPE